MMEVGKVKKGKIEQIVFKRQFKKYNKLELRKMKKLEYFRTEKKVLFLSILLDLNLIIYFLQCNLVI